MSEGIVCANSIGKTGLPYPDWVMEHLKRLNYGPGNNVGPAYIGEQQPKELVPSYLVMFNGRMYWHPNVLPAMLNSSTNCLSIAQLNKIFPPVGYSINHFIWNIEIGVIHCLEKTVAYRRLRQHIFGRLRSMPKEVHKIIHSTY